MPRERVECPYCHDKVLTVCTPDWAVRDPTVTCSVMCLSCALQRPMKRRSLDALGHVLNYVSGQWYALEYGQVENHNRWYAPAMYFLEQKYAEVARG